MSGAAASATPLHEQHCRPLGPEHALDRAAAEAELDRLEPGWRLGGDFDTGGAVIEREFRFEDYYRTLSFVNALAHIANAEDHHPNLEVGYGRCLVRYSTHSVRGLSVNDFICAAKIERLPR